MEELDLKELLTCVWRKKISVIVIIAISIFAGLIYTFNYTTPLYRSSATIILGKVSSTITGETLDANSTISESDLSLNSNLILTYSELIKSRAIMQEVKNNLNSNISVDALIDSVSVTRVNNSDLLSISASSTDPELAKDIVTEVVKIFSESVKEIYKIDNVFIIDTPTVIRSPYNINHPKDVGIFACIGIFLAFAYVFLYTFIDNTVKSAVDIENLLGVKTLITIPLDKKKKEELVTINDSKAIISESFRTLRTNVQFSSVDTKGAQTLLITSCLPAEGKSYVSANLAIAFAQAGKKVILVDSDMRRGRQYKIFNIPNKNGLSNYISNIDSNGMEINWNLGEYIKKTDIANLDVITAGSVPPNPAELLESVRLVELVEDLKKYYNVIIFDGAPILPITDSLLLGRVLGKTMLVAVHGKTKKENLLKAKASIEDVGGKIIGIALNKVSMSGKEYSNNYYYYSDEDKKLTFKEKISKNINEKFDSIKDWINNLLNKVKTIKKRLTAGKTPEEIELEEKKKLEKEKLAEAKKEEKRIQAEQKAKQAAIIAEEKAKLAEEKAKQAAIEAEEKAKKEAELAKIREAEKIKKAEEKARLAEEKAKQAAIEAEEKAKKEAELAKIREEERIRKAEEKAKEDAIMAEEKAKRDAELAKQKEEEMALKAELKKKKEEENAIKKKEKLEQKAQRKVEWNSKLNRFKGKALAKKDEISEEIKVKKEEYTQKYNEYKAIKAEENKEKLAAKAIRDAEIAKIREEERIKREEQRKIQAEEKAKQAAIEAEEKAKRDAEIAKIREEERIKREEERKIQEAEKAKRDAEIAKIREEERIKREEQRKIQAEEKAKQAAILAEEKAKKEAELARIREEERIKKEEQKRLQAEEKAKQAAILAEEKARKEAEAKLTDEYLEENLYPKTKYNKF